MIDGGTIPLDPVAEVAASFGWTSLHSESDRGIYDGMNKGLITSTGRYVWFLNGGDEWCEGHEHSLMRELQDTDLAMMFGEFYLRVADRLILRKPRSNSYINHGLPTSHQAIFYPGEVIRAEQYDLGFTISADYELTARLIKQGVQSRLLSFPVAKFELGGVSEKHARRIAVEAERVQAEILGLPWWARRRSRLKHWTSRQLRLALSFYVAGRNRSIARSQRNSYEVAPMTKGRG